MSGEGAPAGWRRSWPFIVAVLLVILFTAWFGYQAVMRHQTLQSEGYDLGNVDQMVWNTAHGRPFQFTNWMGKDEYVRANSRLAMHVEPIYLLIAPLYRVWADVRLLLLLQAAVVGLGGIGIWLLARDRFASLAGVERTATAEWAATALAAAYLLHPGLQSAVLDDFHAVTLAAGMIPFALFFLLQRHYGRFALLALLIAATKEEMPLVVALMGLYALLFLGLRCPDAAKRRRAVIAGSATFVLGVAWSALALLVIIPAFNVDGQSPYLSRYAHLAGTDANAANLVGTVVAALFQPDSLRYLWDILLSTGFLALLDLPLLLIASPSLAINMLSEFSLQLQGRHYIAPIVPILMAATAGGIANAVRWKMQRGRGKMAGEEQTRPSILHPPSSTLNALFAAVALLFTLAAQFVAGYTPFARDFRAPRLTEHHRLLTRFLAQIPPDASVSTQQTLNPHLTQREQISIVPFDLSGSYVLLDVVSYPDFNNHDIHTWLVKNIVEPGDFGPVDGADGYVLLRRGEPSAPLPDAFYDFARVEAPAPQFPAAVDFGEDVRFLGFDLLENPGAGPFYALYFEPLRPLDRDYFITLYLADERYQLLGGIDLPQKTLVWYPTSLWQPGETVRVVVDTFTWFTDPLDGYSVALGVLAGDDLWDPGQRLRPTIHDGDQSPRLLSDGTLLHLMRFDNTGRTPQPMPEARRGPLPAGVVADDAQFGDLARLVGHRIAATDLKPGDDVVVDLYWQPVTPTNTRFTAFVQLLGPDGRLYGQQDNPPGYGTLTTDRWQPGDLIHDQYRFPVADDAPAGDYRLLVGFYDPATLERIPLVAAEQTHATIEGLRVAP